MSRWRRDWKGGGGKQAIPNRKERDNLHPALSQHPQHLYILKRSIRNGKNCCLTFSLTSVLNLDIQYHD